jgi:membrane protease YdiL (CAAX protease family)
MASDGVMEAPAATLSTPAPRHRVWVTVVLSLCFLLIVVAAEVPRPGKREIGDARSVLRDVDASIRTTVDGSSGQRRRSELASRLTALIDDKADHQANVAEDIRVPARVLLAIVLVDGGADAEAAAALGPIARTPLGTVLRCAFPPLGACFGTPDPLIADEALQLVGGESSRAAQRIRAGLALCCSVGPAGGPTRRRGIASWLESQSPSVFRWALMVAGLGVWIADRRRKRPFVFVATKPVTPPWTFLGFWSALVRWMSASMAPMVAAGVYFGLRKRPFPGLSGWINAAWAAWCVLLVIPLLLRPWGLRFGATFGISWNRHALGVALRAALPVTAAALAGATAISIALFLTAAPGSGLSESQGLSSTEGWSAWTGAIAFTVLATPLIEEVAFRGLLFGTLMPRFGWLGAAVATSALFAVIHPYALAGQIVTGWYGLVFCRSYARRGSLMPSILAHAAINLLAVISYARI